MEDLYSDPAISSTVDFGQIKSGYWWSMNLHGPLNPKDRIPMNSEPFHPKVSAHMWYCNVYDGTYTVQPLMLAALFSDCKHD